MSKKIETLELPVMEGVLLCPFGDFWHEGFGVNQKCDQQAFDTIVNWWNDKGKPEILVDYDHGSESSDDSSEAAAWVSNLRVTNRGLEGDLKFTSSGTEKIAGRDYRYLSPVWHIGEDGRPRDLESLAVTNVPNIQGQPILNRKPDQPAENTDEQPEEETPPDQPAEEPSAEPAQENNMSEELKSRLTEVLGLAPEATDEEILEAVAAAKLKNDEREQEEKEAKATEILERLGLEESDGARDALLKNDASALIEELIAAADKREAEEQEAEDQKKAENRRPDRVCVPNDARKPKVVAFVDQVAGKSPQQVREYILANRKSFVISGD